MTYLLVMLWIVSPTCSSTFKLHLYNLFFWSASNIINGFCASRICCSFDLVFQCFVFFQINLLTLFQMSYFVVIEGNITLKVNNIPINFRIFYNLEKPLAIEPPDPHSVSNILNVSNKPTYSAYTPSTHKYKLSQLVSTAFFTFSTTFLRLFSGNVSI